MLERSIRSARSQLRGRLREGGDPAAGLPPGAPPPELSEDACRSVLARTCFGSLAYNNHGRIDATPIRLVFVEGWLYFAAGGGLRRAIANDPWAVISVSDVLDAQHVASVVVRGFCVETRQTGSARNDAAALRGIVRLRDREPAAATQLRRRSRSHSVLRLRVEQPCGATTRLPCSRVPAINMLNTREGA